MAAPTPGRPGGPVGPPGPPGPPSWLSPRARLLLPVAVSLLVQVPAAMFGWRGPGGRFGVPSFDPSDGWPWSIALALVGSLTLLGARRFPGPVVAVVAAAAIADLLLHPATPGPPFIALAFAIVGAIARAARPWAWVSASALWVAVLVVFLTSDVAPSRAAFSTLGMLAMLGIGEAVRARLERAAAYRRALVERRQVAVEAERVRIARELHDVLAHSLSSINVQAGVGLHLIERDPAAGAAALADIKSTSKTALDEVRSVLGMLRSDDGDSQAPLAPEPDLSQLDRLTASVSARGVEVTLDVHEPLLREIPRPVQFAMYRIAQESLTNVLRHSGAGRATVGVHANDRHYTVEVIDDGTTEPPHDVARAGGRGLLGMRERAEQFGGTLDAAPQAGGGWRVLASIPKPSEEHP